MGLHRSLDVPRVRGVGTIRVLGPDGQVKAECSGKNLLNARFWDSLLVNEGLYSATNSSRRLFNIRTYIGSDKTIPNPYETSTDMIGEGTDHPAGVFSRGAEPVTDFPYIQIRNLYQVTGTARTIYSIGLFNDAGDPQNDINTNQQCVTRLLLPTPVVQGVNDQIDLIYRLYFEENANSPTHPAYWATVVDWAMTRTSWQTLDSASQTEYGCVLGMGGVGYNQYRQSTSLPVYNVNNTTYSRGGQWLRAIDHRAFNTDSIDRTFYRSAANSHYYWDSTFRTDKDYLYGELFNEWWPRDGYIQVSYPAWLGSNSGIQGNTIYQHSAYRLTKFREDETNTTGPFHNSFNFSSTSDSLVYDIDNLPQTTWRAVFGGTWPSADRYPLFARMWWDESGAVDGSSAKYKLAFVRSLGTTHGRASDEIYRLRGEQLKGVRDDQYSLGDIGFPGQTYWTFESDLANGHHEYQNSRFGNLGFAKSAGTSADYHTDETPVAPDNQYKRVINTRKVVGLTTNTWWGWQSGKYGKSAHLGVEWRKLFPFSRKVWQKADISSNLNQIDWLEAVNGLPGEVDDEMCVIVDKTSGVYLINATQDSVTQLTTLTGLDQCTVTRDQSSGNLIYTGIKYEADEVLFYESTNNWQVSDLFGFGSPVGGASPLTSSSTTSQWFSRSNEGSKLIFQPGYNWPTSVSSTNFKAVPQKLQRSSLYYDGYRDSLRVGVAQNTTFFDIGSNDDFTVEVWVRPSEFLNDQSYRLIVDYDELHINAQTNYGVKIGSNTLPAFYTTSSESQWDHLAVVRESGTVTAYKNGAVHAVLSGQDTTALSPGQYVGMGGSKDSVSDSKVLKGYLQQVRVTKAARYSGAFTPESFSNGDASTDQFFGNTLLSWTTEVQPLSVSNGGDNYVDGCHSNLATTGSATGSGLTVNAYVWNNAVDYVALEDRGSGYKVGDKVTATIPTLTNPTAGEVLTLDQTTLVGGSGYVDGSYTVALSGGLGQNVQATVTVTAGAVSTVVLDAGNRGTGYAAGDQLFASDAELGNSGNGAGFSVEVATVDEQTNLTAVAVEIEIQSIATKLEPWWNSYGHRTVVIRRHWRHPDLFVGLFQSSSSNYAYCLDLNSDETMGYSGAMSNASYGYIGEFFGDQGETGGITEFYIGDSNSYENQREVAWADWIQFEPNGLVARAIGLDQDSSMAHWKKKYSTVIKTQRTYASSRYEFMNNCGSDPWTAPHSILQIANAENSTYPHYVIGQRDQVNYNYDYQRHTGDAALIIKGGNRETDNSLYESRESVVTNMKNGDADDYRSTGKHTGSIPTPGVAFAEKTDSTSTGVYKESGYEKYKGLATDGGTVNFYAPMWCGRDNADITTTSKAFPGAWPIDPQNDAVIPHPLRWDIYGWDSSSSAWVREEWGYNYTEHRWEVDTATVKPGRPAPSGGGTHSLSGITESPYNNLTVTFSNVRPEDTNNPIQGEWSGQFIYNGCVMDGITEFTFSATVSNRPITVKTINQTIPSSGVITIPEVYEDTFIKIFNEDHYFDLKIDGDKATIDDSLDYTDTVDDGTVCVKDYQFKFSANDVGKSLTGSYAVVNFASAEAPTNWAWWTAEHGESVNATTTGLLGGNSYKNSATLISEGWTMETESDSRVQIFASNYPNQFSDGFAYLRQPSPHLTDGHYAETILVSRDNIGFFWHDGQSSLSYRDYINYNSNTNNPKYGGMQWLYDDNHQLTCVHSKLYTDSSGDNWLVIRATWTHNTNELTDPRIIGELWISVDDPFTYEVRFGEWTSGLFDIYSGAKNIGIAYTDAYRGGTSTYNHIVFPHRKPYAASGLATYTSNINSYSIWGGDIRDNYPNHKYEINLDPHDYNEPN